MSSYNSYDGVPMVSNSEVLTDILRGEWGYDYFVISDAGGTARLANAFYVCGIEDNDCITLEVCQRRNFFRDEETNCCRVYPLATMSRWAVDTLVSSPSLH